MKTKYNYDITILKEVIYQIRNLCPHNNPYFVYRSLSDDSKSSYSFEDLIILYYRLRWNCRLIKLVPYESVIETPWMRTGMTEKIESYQLLPEFTYELQGDKSFLNEVLFVINSKGIVDHLAKIIDNKK